MNETLNNNSFKKLCKVRDRSPDPIAKAIGLRSITLGREDLQKAEKFFVNFGLEVVERGNGLLSLRGKGDKTASIIIERGENTYKGFTVQVETESDLERLSQKTGSEIKEPAHHRGGSCIHLTDPTGIIVEAICNPKTFETEPTTLPVSFNYPGQYGRINETIRIAKDFPPRINRLGHTVLGVANAAKNIHWYQDTFGMIVSDFQFLDNDPIPVTAFMRFDRGDIPTDHHSIALVSAVDIGHAHTSFEVRDFDTVMSCNMHLKREGYHHTWGVGRHIFGSQVFDYWRDPEGDMFEHYADGDLFDSSVPTGYNRFAANMIYQWGPKMTADMAGKIPSLSRIKTIVDRIASDDDLTLRRLIGLVKASGVQEQNFG